MPYCVALQRVVVSAPNKIVLAATDDQTVETMATIVERAYPSARFSRTWVRLRDDPGQLLDCLLLTSDEEIGVSSLRRLGALLVNHVTIEDGLDECHALDYHQSTEGDRFTRTQLGERVYRAKNKGSREQRIEIGNMMSAFIQNHPAYDRADFLSFVPAHDPGVDQSLSSRLAGQICETMGKTIHAVKRARARDQQKGIDNEERATALELRRKNQSGSMRCSPLRAGADVILVDDLYGTGESLAEAARVLRSAGASRVLGLAATKQLKFARYR